MTRPPGVLRPVLTQAQRRERTARRETAALGYDEAVTYAFVSQAAAAPFGGGTDATRLENPISQELSHLRPDLLPGLLQAAARAQARGEGDMALFEAGHVFDGGAPGEQRFAVTGLLIGQAGPRGIHGERRPWDVFDTRADAEALLEALGAPARVQVLRGAAPWLHPGRSGRICLGPKKVLAEFGELHPRVLRTLDVKGPAVSWTVHPAAIPVPRSTGASRGAADLPELQAVERDFAFVVGAEVEAQAVVDAARGADKALIDGVRVFDAFEGGALEAGARSLGITVRLQPRAATLTDKEIEAVSAKVVEKVGRATGGRLRG
jgi:phenylalanyl-tRNA synthetase beta chain